MKDKRKVSEVTIRVNGSEYRYAGGGCPYCTSGFLIPSPPPESTAWRNPVYRCLKCARRFVINRKGSVTPV